MPQSATPSAPSSLEELKELLRNDTKVKVAVIDVDGVLRGKIMSKDKFLSAAKSGFGFCGVIFGWDINDSTYFKELKVSNKANGYRDLLAEIDLNSYRRLPWEQNVPLFLARLCFPEDGRPLDVDPRSLLKRVLDQAEEKGWQAMSGAEFEYFQFSETPQTLAQKGFTKLNALTPGMHGYSMIRPQLNVDYFHDLYDQATDMGIEVEGHHTETGPGVFETALGYTDTGRMADNAVLFKLVAKSVGVRYGIMPTFMAKPYSDMPGCSGHIHVSLREGNRNIFAAETPREGDSDLKFFSPIAESFLAGLLEGLADVIPMMCPNINSYKRLLGGEAMWAPDTASYGYESRAASIRLIGPPLASPSAARFEVRIPGADMNTHYAMAAIYALGLRGISKQLKITSSPYGQPGSTYAELLKLPTSLESATAAFMREGSIAREVFGDLFVDHFGGTREHELEMHRRAVTSWEVERYFELA